MTAIQRFVQQRHDTNLDAAYAAERKEHLSQQTRLNALRLRLFRTQCDEIRSNNFSGVRDWFNSRNSKIKGTIVVNAKSYRILL